MKTFARVLECSTVRVAGAAMVAVMLSAPTTAFATVYGLESNNGAPYARRPRNSSSSRISGWQSRSSAT